MGAMAEALMAYAQPLLEQTDGSLEQMNKAFAIAQFCYDLALLPEDRRATMLAEMQPSLRMSDTDFEQFLRDIVLPMLRRHEEMFPRMHQRASTNPWQSAFDAPSPPTMSEPAMAYAGTDRYAPCPCGSGEKYKFCCSKKRR